MSLTLKDYLQAVVDTVRDPVAGAKRVMSINMSRAQRWETLVLILVISILLAETTLLMSGGSGDAFLSGPAFENPIILAALQLFFLVVMVNAIYFGGRRAGGHGGLDDAILLVAWLQFILICLQAIQIVALLTVPAVGALIGIASVVIFFWLLTNFVAELHGFRSRGNIFGVILLAIFAFAVLLSIVFSVLGIQIAG
jgi:hypothetical protein